MLAHPLLLDQLERLIRASAQEHATISQPTQGANTKLLGHLVDLITSTIPRDPGAKEFRHGGTLVKRNYWFRAKTGNGRYRLFYRFSSTSRAIVLVWVNDEASLRTYGGRADAYRVFGQMLEAGNPPDTWEQLYAAASSAQQIARLSTVLKGRARTTPPHELSDAPAKKPAKKKKQR